MFGARGPGSLVQIFDETPLNWGQRGDPYLWASMMARAADEPWPVDVDELRQRLNDSFEDLTGHQVDEHEPFFVSAYSHGGLSSGMVSPVFWRTEAIPFLADRYLYWSHQRRVIRMRRVARWVVGAMGILLILGFGFAWLYPPSME